MHPKINFPSTYFHLLITACCFSLTTASHAESKPHTSAIKANNFATALVTLSHHLIKQQAVISEESLGGYGGVTNDLQFYKQIKTIRKKDRRPISTISWETQHPDKLHSVDVYVYDEQNRLIRDYSASYLPGSRRAPYQTLINLHHYSGKLHGVRQFDALDEILTEECEGRINDQPVAFSFDYSEIPDSAQNIKDPVLRQAYPVCFNQSLSSAAPYTDPLVEIKTIHK